MGKATRWLKGLLGMKKGKEQFDNSTTSSSVVPEKKEKKRWSFTKSGKGDVDNDYFLRSYVAEKENEQNKHAIAVAAATAAAADAAVAAAQAAVAVVRLRSNGSGRLYCGSMEWWAALKIQSFFRGYLARKALRALKGLVKIQALVRGYLIRKRAAATLYSMQALMRAQVAVTSQRARRSIGKESSTLQSEIHHARKYVHRFDETRSEFQTRRVAASYRTSLNEFGFDESIKNVEIDNYDKPRLSSRRRAATTMSECGEELRYPYLVPGRISFAECRNPQWYFDVDECKFSTAHSTPRIANCCMLHNAPATPVKSVNGDTFIRPCPNSPNYMANTKSSKAKLRSHSAPKQRPEFKKRLSVDEIMAARNSTRSQTQELSLVNKVMEGYCVNWENQKENLRAN